MATFSSVPRAAAAVAFCAGLIASSTVFAAHKPGVSPGWKLCRSSSPDDRIAGCTQVIAEIGKEIQA